MSCVHRKQNRVDNSLWRLWMTFMALTVASLPLGIVFGQQVKAIESQEMQMLEATRQGVARVTQVMEKWISSEEVTEDRLFARLYYPILDPNSKEPRAIADPPKFSTEYDQLADRDIKPIEDGMLTKSTDITFVVVVDKNGYLPSHNTRYSQTLTGDRKMDLVNNRTKRIFCDRTGLQAARNTNPYLIQSYKRDTGETMNDISMPIYINGKHWGALRIGYRVNEQR